MRQAGGALAVLGLGLMLAVSGCAADDTHTAPHPSATEHNDADVAFATDMIPHHAQALMMVDMVQGRTLDPDFQALTKAIREAQAPEIELMADWLQEWGEEVPATDRDHVNAEDDMGHMDHMDDSDDSDHDMPGMMSGDDLDALGAAGDDTFEDMWLQMMIEHHEGAIEMARTELEQGQYQPTLDLARRIISAQQAEIETMKTMLNR